MGKNFKKVWMTLNYIEQLLILVPAITGCVSIYAFASLTGITVGITRASIKFKIAVIAAVNKKYK